MDPICLSTEIQIAAPRDAVWRLLTDLPSYAQWNPYLVKVDGVAESGAAIIVHSVLRPGMEPVSQPVTVVSVEPYRMRWEGGLPDRSLFKGDHWFVLEEQSGGTLLRHYENFSGSKAEAIIGQHEAVILNNFRIFNEALKAASET
jgi:hypothetical protein